MIAVLIPTTKNMQIRLITTIRSWIFLSIKKFFQSLLLCLLLIAFPSGNYLNYSLIIAPESFISE